MANEITIKIPDIGGATQVDVIEIMVKAGEMIQVNSPLITLESDKASMEIPSPSAGEVKEIKIKVGDKVSEGDVILTLNAEPQLNLDDKPVEESPPAESEPLPIPASAPTRTPAIIPSPQSEASYEPTIMSAGPAVRRLAREFGIDLAQVKGSGRKSRILKEDLQAFVKTQLSEKNSNWGPFIPSSAPLIDFTKFGETETKPLNKIKRLTGVNVHRAWVTIPHVTQFDEADITDLEAFRKTEALLAEGYKLTLLAFVAKIAAKALEQFPQFNASLDQSAENLIYKKYFNIGIAVETPQGLVVPVIKNVDKLSIKMIALQMGRLSKQAREKGIMPQDMSGGCFTLSSLGGIGGTAFTPIVNSPEVAILGLSRSSIKPVFDGGEFKPRLMLPLSLSYDHRVIDGAEAARFTRFIAEMLGDIRKIIL